MSTNVVESVTAVVAPVVTSTVEITSQLVDAVQQKRIRNPKPVAPEMAIVCSLVEHIRDNRFTEETVALIKSIFGREFCLEKGLDTPTEEELAAKKKPRKTAAKKVVDPDAAPVEKKPRKTAAAKKIDVAVDATEGPDAVAVKEKKPRKPAAAKKVSETVVTETTEPTPVAEATEVKPKKPRAKKTTQDSNVVGEAPEIKEKKPRKPAAKKTTETGTAEEVKNAEEVKEKKPRKPASKKTPELPVHENTFQEPTPRKATQDEFAAEWKEELVEEELSDIEDEA